MLRLLGNNLTTRLSKLPVTWLLLVPFCVIGLFMFLLLNLTPDIDITRWVGYTGIILLVLLSRMLQTWEYGIEIYSLVTFCFAFVYGPSAGILFTISTSIIVIYVALFLKSHIFNHSLNGPLIQTIELLVISIIAGLLGRFTFTHTLTLNAFTQVGMATLFLANYLIGGYLTLKITPLDVERIMMFTLLNAVVNYNLFLFLGRTLVGFFGV